MSDDSVERLNAKTKDALQEANRRRRENVGMGAIEKYIKEQQ
jgi:hypothetical protein